MNGTNQNLRSAWVIVFFLFLACGSSNDKKTITTTKSEVSCDYNGVDIKAYQVGTDVLLDEKFISGCFVRKVVDESLGLVEISNEIKSITVSYYIESDPKVLRFLDIKTETGEPSRWRANQGHDLFISETDEELNFIFGDRKESKIKGTIRFTK